MGPPESVHPWARESIRSPRVAEERRIGLVERRIGPPPAACPLHARLRTQPREPTMAIIEDQPKSADPSPLDAFKRQLPDPDPQETTEWIGALDDIVEHVGRERA